MIDETSREDAVAPRLKKGPGLLRRTPSIRLRLGLGLILAVISLTRLAHAGGVVTSLTEAAFRAALTGGGTVTFTNDGTVTLGQQVVINHVTTINANGHNVVISGSNGVALFEVSSNLTLTGLTLANGSSQTLGGALDIGDKALVVATRCIFAGNNVTATNGIAGANGITNSGSTGPNGIAGTAGSSATGGAIYNRGSLALNTCTFTNNSAIAGAGGDGGTGGTGATGLFILGGNGGDGGAGGSGFGGAVYNLGNLYVINCSFSGNSAKGGVGGQGGAGGAGTTPGMPGNGAGGGTGSGGAIFNGGNMTLIASTLSANITLGGASAIAGVSGNGTGLNGRSGGQGSGGAIFNNWWAVVTNCTFYTNAAIGGAGGNGGIGAGTFAVPGNGGNGGNGTGGALASANTITIVSCTFSSSGAFGGTNGVAGTGSSTASDGNFGNAQGGNIANVGPIMTLMESIIASSAFGANTFGAFTDGGWNLSSDAASSLGSSTSEQKVDPKLGSLAAHGGPTLTMALLSGSPAIDKIDPQRSPPTDQRGFARPANGLSDIGAFEFGAAGNGASNLVVSIARVTNGVVQLNGAGTVGLPYVVQASTNLVNWQSISTNIAPIQFNDPFTNVPVRFYRITR
jgi:hypothetical protein